MTESYEPIPLPDYSQIDATESLQRAKENYEFIRKRHTVRDFASTAVARETIEYCLRAAGTAPSGANHQPWHFVCVENAEIKRQIREAAEEEERAFYDGRAGEDWLKDLEKLGTDAEKPFLEVAPWLIAIFVERYGVNADGSKRKNYYTTESVGLATGLLISALHSAGLATLTHTPSPMKFLNRILGRPSSERPFLLLVVGHPTDNAAIPLAATQKKALPEISSFV